jgi:hypothetical protein
LRVELAASSIGFSMTQITVSDISRWGQDQLAQYIRDGIDRGVFYLFFTIILAAIIGGFAVGGGLVGGGAGDWLWCQKRPARGRRRGRRHGHRPRPESDSESGEEAEEPEVPPPPHGGVGGIGVVRARAGAAPLVPRLPPATPGSGNRFYSLTNPQRGSVGIYVGYTHLRRGAPRTQPGDFYAFRTWEEAAEYYLSVFPDETVLVTRW